MSWPPRSTFRVIFSFGISSHEYEIVQEMLADKLNIPSWIGPITFREGRKRMRNKERMLAVT